MNEKWESLVMLVIGESDGWLVITVRENDFVTQDAKLQVLHCSQVFVS